MMSTVQNPEAEKPNTSSDPTPLIMMPSAHSTEHGTQAHTEPLSGWRLVVVLFCLGFGLLLSVMDTSIIATALVTISVDFDGFDKSNWAVLAYTLTYMAFATIFARLSDVLGRKLVVFIAFTIFTIFSLACGLARTLVQLIIFRALQGIGGSGLYAMTMVVFPEITPPNMLIMMSAVYGAAISVAGVLGPILGGVITKYASWRWIFLMNVPCGAFVMLLIIIAWFKHGQDTAVNRISVFQMDYLGGLLLLAGSILLVFSLQEGGNRDFAWRSAALISALILSFLCFGLLLAWQIYLTGKSESHSVQSILPLRLVGRRIIAAGVLTTALTGFSFLVVVISLPQRFQIVNGDDTVMAGVHLLPMLVALGTGAGVGAMVCIRRNYTFVVLCIASCFVLTGCGLLSTVSDDLKIPPRLYGYQAIHGFGVGLTMSAITLMVTVEAEFQDAAIAQGIVSQARIFGGSIGIAMSTIVFNDKAQSLLSGILTPSQLGLLHKSPAVVATWNLTEQLAVRTVFATSFNDTLRVCTYVSAVGVVVTLMMFQKHPPDVMQKKIAQMEYVRQRREVHVV